MTREPQPREIVGLVVIVIISTANHQFLGMDLLCEVVVSQWSFAPRFAAISDADLIVEPETLEVAKESEGHPISAVDHSSPEHWRHGDRARGSGSRRYRLKSVFDLRSDIDLQLHRVVIIRSCVENSS